MIKYFCLTLCILLTTIAALSQSLAALDERNGFQDIKMTANVTSYEGLEYKKDIKDEVYPNAKLYTPKKGFYDKIGDLKIYDLQVKTYNDQIYEIRVITEKDPNLYRGLKQAFGQPEFSYRAGKSRWVAENLQLSYDDVDKNKMEMVYYSFVMLKNLKEDKKEEVQEIVDDF